MSPQNRGRLDEANAVSVSGAPGEGPFFVLQCRVTDGTVVESRFQSHNCGVTVACGSALTELIIGKTVEHCLQIEIQDLNEVLDGIPVDKQHVPMLAIDTLRRALSEFPK